MMANHISSRVPGEPGAFLINAYGMMYEEITASSLIKVDLAGNDPRRSPTSAPRLRHQQGGLRDPQRRARRAARGRLRDPHAQLGVDGGVVARVRPAADHADRDALPEDRLPRLPGRGARRRTSRRRCSPTWASGEALILRNHGALVVGRTRRRGVQLDAPARARVPRADRARWRATRRCARCRAEVLEATWNNYQPRHAPALRPDGVAGAAAQARPHRPELPRLSRRSTRETAHATRPLRARAALPPRSRPARVRAQAPTIRRKPVRVVVAFTAGGTTDILARAVGQKLARAAEAAVRHRQQARRAAATSAPSWWCARRPTATR